MEYLQDLLAAIGVVLNGIPQGLLAMSFGFASVPTALGFIVGAVVATLVIYLTLNSLKKVIVRGKAGKALYVEVKDLAEQVPKISKIIKRTGTVVHSMEILYEGDSKLRKKKDTSTIKAIIFPKTDEATNLIVSTLQNDENVVDVYVD